jgi:hypothetical protein
MPQTALENIEIITPPQTLRSSHDDLKPPNGKGSAVWPTVLD